MLLAKKHVIMSQCNYIHVLKLYILYIVIHIAFLDKLYKAYFFL